VERSDQRGPGSSPGVGFSGSGILDSMATQRRLVMSTTGRGAATAQEAEVPGITRIDLQRQDLSAPGRELIQNRVEISDEAPLIRHKHPGEEIIYVLEGSLEYQIDGRPARTYHSGEALIVPPETVHAVRNAGEGNGVELATYVVEKGKPFIVLADD
jgi:quercetin dioxygenase-like cupin family protein